MIFINYMRLFNYMRLIYHVARLMSRKIFITPGDKELLKSGDEGKGLQTGRRKEMGSEWTLKTGLKPSSLRQGVVYKTDQFLKSS
jgi:hypothetical protein